VAHHLYIGLVRFFGRYGYWAIFITIFLENTGVPAPGDTVVIFAGFISHRGTLRLSWTILTATIAAILGQCVGFTIGRLGGELLIDRYRRRLLVPYGRYIRAQRIFLRNAAWAVFIARFVMVLRELAGILSGVFRFPFPRFLIWNAAGAVAWSASMGCLGYFLSQNWKRLLHFASRMEIGALVVFVIIVVIIVVVRQRQGEAWKR
jgi:membrane protein DedA with SNARE-associated domain